MLVKCYLGVGSNIGDRRQNIVNALRELDQRHELVALSSLYETEPVGYVDQDYFLNAVVHVSTAMTAMELLDDMHRIENKLGRKRVMKWGPRVIDVDILTFGNHMISEAQLTVPHPQVPNRRFVLEPWAEIAPDFTVPGFHKTVSLLLNETVDHSIVSKNLSASNLESLVKEG